MYKKAQLNRQGVPKQAEVWHLHWSDVDCFLYHTLDRSKRKLNSSAALVWSLCDGKRTIANIEQELVTLFPENSKEVVSDLTITIQDFIEKGLIHGNLIEQGYPEPTKLGPRRKLCIGMATYDDYDGVYFTVQAIRMFHPEVIADTEILVLDNNPKGPCAKPLKQLDAYVENYRYFPYAEKSGTAVRDQLFREANADNVLCIDCHVFLVPGSIRKLIEFFDQNPTSMDAIQGPMLYDNLTDAVTHMDPEWRDGMYGTWSFDERGKDPNAPPFEIPMHGMGLLACRQQAWPGLNPRFSGFGGEEGYIHEKFRQRGGKILCLPFLRWMHRFNRPLGVPYRVDWESRIRNYLIGASELNIERSGIIDHFNEKIGEKPTTEIVNRVTEEINSPFYFFDAIYCINLDNQTDRWKNMCARFERLKISHRVIRFSAIETPENHHLGCALSHRGVVQNAKAHGYENVLVLEDDTIFLDNAINHLRASIEELEHLNWQIFYLGGCLRGMVDRSLPTLSYLQSCKNLTCTHAVAYHHSSYPHLLDNIPRDEKSINKWIEEYLAIDQWLPIAFKNAYLCKPKVASQKPILPLEDLQYRNRFS